MGKKLSSTVLRTSILLNDAAGRWPFLGAHQISHLEEPGVLCELAFHSKTEFGGEYIARTLDI